MDNSGLGGLCAECLDNTYCPDERPYCGADNLCQAQSQGICRDPLDCQDASRALCAFEEDGQIGTCVECSSDMDCVRPRPSALQPAAAGSEEEVPCDANADECGVLRTCVDGACDRVGGRPLEAPSENSRLLPEPGCKPRPSIKTNIFGYHEAVRLVDASRRYQHKAIGI